MSDVQRSQSALFFERYAKAEHASLTLKYTAWLLGGVCVCLGAALVYVTTLPRPVIYVPAADIFGAGYPGQVPEASVRSFAAFWVMGWMNYTPETAAGAYARAFPLLSPALLSRLRAQAGKELEKIGRDRLSSVFVPGEEGVVTARGKGFEVRISGERVVYIGKEQMSSQRLTIVLDVARAYPTEKNPYGLVISEIRKEKEGGYEE
jgi:hypothetical protein